MASKTVSQPVAVATIALDVRHVELAKRAAADIGESVMVLSEYQFVDIEPAVLQMVQQRVHTLAMSIFESLDSRPRPADEIHSELYPSEPRLTARAGHD